MKKLFFALGALAILGTSCSKDEATPTPPYECTACASVPDAAAANNTSSKGIYKGVVTASSGTITFNISNTSDTIYAVLVLDGQTINLAAATPWSSGSSYISAFTGMLNGQPVTVNFEVGSDGSTPIITSSNIPGHPNAEFTVVKETSTMLIEGFQGTYTEGTSTSGVFNILLSRDANIWGGSSRENGDTTSQSHSGIIDNNRIMEDGTHIGTLNGDNISGSFVNSSSQTVTLLGRRTL